MQDRGVLFRRRVDQWIVGSITLAVMLQMLIMASDVQYVTNLAKPKLGAYTIGLWHSTLGFNLYQAFAYLVVVSLASTIVLATIEGKRPLLAGLAFGILFYGVLFGHILPDIEQNLWVWGGLAAFGGFMIALLGDFFGVYGRRAVPDDASELTRSQRRTSGTHAGS